MEHRGRNALVTGATGGLGVAECQALAKAGAAVLMLDRKGADEAEAINARLPAEAPKVRYVECDLADPHAAQDLVKKLDGEVGGIDILINNAAINPLKPIDAYPLAEYEQVQAVNATSALALAQVVVPSMKKKGWGQIVNICSVTLNGGWSDFTAYVASKGTLLGLTRSMARELGKFNIRVNAVSPGAIPTQLEKEVWADQLETYEKFLLDHQALKYRGSAEDIAEAILFLVSDRARFITGQNLIGRRRLVDALSFLKVKQIELSSSDLRLAVLPELGGGIARLDLKAERKRDPAALGRHSGRPQRPRLLFSAPLVEPRLGRRHHGRRPLLRAASPTCRASLFRFTATAGRSPGPSSSREAGRLRLALDSASQPPFDYRAELDYALAGPDARHPPRASSIGACRACPTAWASIRGCHAHPARRWRRRPTPSGSRTSATSRPAASPSADRPDWDFSSSRPLPEGWINNGFVGWNGRARIAWPDRGLAPRYRGDARARAPISSISPSAAADFFCFEPVSHAVDAFHLPGGPETHGLRLLQPGDRLEAGLRLTVRHAAP